MSLSTSGRTWDEASSPSAVALARRFESAWRGGSDAGRRPDLSDFLADAGDRPGARLALLRAEMALRWEAGERPDARDYRARFPDLEDETFVALVYEEFCLREEGGEAPDPADFMARHPEVAPALRRVLDIHGLVGSGSGESTLTRSFPPAPATPFPQTGETIAGFRLMEELGRGAFARVFRAQERQLADRPVALKVARTGSREPQTLARLQHTHIVPVYSYRTDPGTGLHLLCMPYFGRVTLARVLADPKVKVARSGADLVAAIDRLGESEPAAASARSTGRTALSKRSYHQAIAWWGARMAEALDHAHDRGVLHRDVKPSNVLVTSDGMPMLLDFNLARASVIDGGEAERTLPGGTLDYMAPEHIDELADGASDRVDARSDVYGLGVLLYEALMGARPFPPPRGAVSAGAMLDRAAEDRRRGAPKPRATRPEIPAALESVVLRCLEPDPNDRYATAAELAADLQAVADDRPLRYAHEPLPARAYRWARRHRRALAMAVPVLLAAVGLMAALARDRLERNRLWADSRQFYDAGRIAEESDDLERAKALYDSSARVANRPSTAVGGVLAWVVGPGADLEGLKRQARNRLLLVDRALQTRRAADHLIATADHLRFRLIGLGGDLKPAATDLKAALEPFHVFESENWTRWPDLTADLDPARYAALTSTVNELLFLYALALDERGGAGPLHDAAQVCDGALRFAAPAGPWRALRARVLARLSGDDAPAPEPAERPEDEPTALGCFQWGALRLVERRPSDALPALRRAFQLDEGNYWYQFYLGFAYERTATVSTWALGHYDAAVALKPRSPYVRFTRARLYRIGNSWGRAKEEFQRALDEFRLLPPSVQDPSFESKVRLELGLARQSLGDLAGARADYDAVTSAAIAPYARAARLNRAKLDADAGAVGAARKEYDALLAADPAYRPARYGRALLALRVGDPDGAESDLNTLLRSDLPAGERADVLSSRALARLVLGRASEAASDADESLRLKPGPRVERLRTRARVALGRVGECSLDRPDDVEALPINGAPLRADLTRLVDRLRSAAASATPQAELRMRLTLAVALAVLGSPPAAEAEADRATELAPLSTRAFLIRARVRLFAGRTAAARLDTEQAIKQEPDDPRVWELRGEVRAREGDISGALSDFNIAIALGDEGAIRGRRAAALLAVGDAEGAVRDWTAALSHDPDDPRAYLGRAEAFLHLKLWDQALADLEQAAGWAEGRPWLVLKILRAYARCLPSRPEQTPRFVGLIRRAWASSRGV